MSGMVTLPKDVELTYAIGDVHGCAMALWDLLDQIRWHAGDRGYVIVFLGDYVDRGTDSREVITLVQLALEDGHIALKGNHEDMMVEAYRGDGLRHWLANGGTETLAAYGGSIPPDIIEWAESLPTLAQDDLRYYVHAGLQPGLTAEESSVRARLWIRGIFLDANCDFGKVVVHGHTPEAEPEVEPHRVNVDTGCVGGGNLTAAIFDAHTAHPIGFLKAARGSRDRRRRDSESPDPSAAQGGHPRSAGDHQG